MGIYISSMEMPVAGQTILVAENWDGSIYARIEESFDNFHSVIEVPDHGRLIDADAVSLDGGPYDYDDWCKWAFEQYQDAPTIIPADDKDTNVPIREEGE